MKNFSLFNKDKGYSKDMHALNISLKQGFNMMLYNILFSAFNNLLSKCHPRYNFFTLFSLKLFQVVRT